MRPAAAIGISATGVAVAMVVAENAAGGLVGPSLVRLPKPVLKTAAWRPPLRGLLPQEFLPREFQQ